MSHCSEVSFFILCMLTRKRPAESCFVNTAREHINFVIDTSPVNKPRPLAYLQRGASVEPFAHIRTCIESAQARRTAKTKKHPFSFTVWHPRHHPRVRFFVFCGPSARYSVFFWCKIVAFILRVPSRPLLHFWAEHAFLAFFGTGDLQFCEARRLGLVRPLGPS